MADMLGWERATGAVGPWPMCEGPRNPPIYLALFFLHPPCSLFHYLSLCFSYLCTLSLVFVLVPRRFATAASSVNTELTLAPTRIFSRLCLPAFRRKLERRFGEVFHTRPRAE